MVAKIFCILAVAAVVTAESGYSWQHIHRHHDHIMPISVHDHHGHHHHDYYAPPKYEYKYEVKDPHTHDHKTHDEHREGDVVKGYYSLQEPDGSIRHVHYVADKHTGFHAEVTHTPGHHHH